MRCLGLIIALASFTLFAGSMGAQERKGEKKESPKAFVKIIDDGTAEDSAGLVVEVQGFKVEFLASGTFGLKTEPSGKPQPTPNGGFIYSFNGYQPLLKQTAGVLETVKFQRGPKKGKITIIVPQGHLIK